MLRVSDGLPGGLVDLWRLFWNQTCTCRGVTFRSVAIFFRVSTEGNLSFWNICSSIDSALEGMFQRVDFPLRLRPAPASPASSGAVSSSGRCRGDSGRPMGSPSAPSKLWAMRHRAARGLRSVGQVRRFAEGLEGFDAHLHLIGHIHMA